MQRVLFDHVSEDTTSRLLRIASEGGFTVYSKLDGDDKGVASKIAADRKLSKAPLLCLAHIDDDGLAVLLENLEDNDIVVRFTGTGAPFDLTPVPQYSGPLLLNLRQRLDEIDGELLKMLVQQLSAATTVDRLRHGQPSAALYDSFRFVPPTLLRSIYFLTFIPLFAPAPLKRRAATAAWWRDTLSGLVSSGTIEPADWKTIPGHLLKDVASELCKEPRDLDASLPKTVKLLRELAEASFEPTKQDWTGIQDELANLLSR